MDFGPTEKFPVVVEVPIKIATEKKMLRLKLALAEQNAAVKDPWAEARVTDPGTITVRMDGFQESTPDHRARTWVADAMYAAGGATFDYELL